jgi:excinuclease UvrABC nuclease subunit
MFERKPFVLFTEDAIKLFVPPASGVYAIYGASGIIYIGESNDMERRLLEHVNEPGTCIHLNSPTDCTWELVANNQRRIARQDALILLLNPPCNKKLG